MAEYIVSSNQAINWNVKGNARIIQNVSNILNTFRYEIAYDRALGRDPSIVDLPQDKLVPMLVAETYELIEEYEPRAKLKSVNIVNKDGDNIIEAVVDIE